MSDALKVSSAVVERIESALGSAVSAMGSFAAVSACDTGCAPVSRALESMTARAHGEYVASSRLVAGLATALVEIASQFEGADQQLGDEASRAGG